MTVEKSVDVVKRIRAHYDAMSKGQQRVAEFLLTRGLEAIYLPAARIAEMVEVSHSTVVRTAQAIGFEGFPDLQTALQEQLLGRINSATVYQLGTKKLIRELAEQQEEADAASVLQRVMQTDAKNIESLIPQISVADFEHTVSLIHQAPKVYVVGLRSSSPLAMSLGLGLSHIRPNCFILQPGFGDLVDQVAAISKGDVLLSICFGRYMRDTLRCMEYARTVGAQVVTFTDTPLSPAAKRADVVFVVRYGVWFYGASAAVFSLMNAIVGAVLLRGGEDAQRRLEQIDGIIDHFQVFEPYGDDGQG